MGFNQWARAVQTRFCLLVFAVVVGLICQLMALHHQGMTLRHMAQLHQAGIQAAVVFCPSPVVVGQFREDGLLIGVKNWETTVTYREIEAFLDLKAKVEQKTTRTAYLLYSENGFTPEQETVLEAAGVMYSTSARLTAYEASLDA